MRYFISLSTSHFDVKHKESKEGDIVESNHDMTKMFPNKFKEIFPEQIKAKVNKLKEVAPEPEPEEVSTPEVITSSEEAVTAPEEISEPEVIPTEQCLTEIEFPEMMATDFRAEKTEEGEYKIADMDAPDNVIFIGNKKDVLKWFNKNRGKKGK